MIQVPILEPLLVHNGRHKLRKSKLGGKLSIIICESKFNQRPMRAPIALLTKLQEFACPRKSCYAKDKNFLKESHAGSPIVNMKFCSDEVSGFRDNSQRSGDNYGKSLAMDAQNHA